jgi:ketosteroid isomerase-like protein
MESATDDIGQNMILEYRDAPGFDETAERNRSLITDALEGLLEGDSEALWRIFDSDVTFYEASCLPYGGSHRGIEATKAAFARLQDCFSAMHSRMEAVLASRDVVVAYQNITFTAKATGKSGTLTVCELFRFRDGKVIEWRAHYLDACLVASAFKH